MASIFTHAVVPIVGRISAGKDRISSRLLEFGIVAAMLPDADVVAFRFGIPYESEWGHRGFTHSIAFALFIGLLAAAFARRLNTSRWTAFVFMALTTASHGMLDAMTNGGHGVAFFWPFVNERYFLPWELIEVSPIGAAGFFSQGGLEVLKSEIGMVWIPLFSVGLFWARLRAPARSRATERSRS